MTMKFKMGPDGVIIPAEPTARPGERRGTPIWVLEVQEIPEGTEFKKVGQLLDQTRIPKGAFKIQFTQLGKNLENPAAWPDKRKAPKSVKNAWNASKK